MTTQILTNAKWKLQYQVIFQNTPKKLRRNKTQITNLKSQAKIYTELWN